MYVRYELGQQKADEVSSTTAILDLKIGSSDRGTIVHMQLQTVRESDSISPRHVSAKPQK